MRKIRCYECRKSYDYDEDAFCPWCGAFNQRGTAESRARFGEAGVRVDGLNEAGHAGSFLHREFHDEERQRRRQGLDQKQTTAGKTPYSHRPDARQSRGRGQKKPKMPFFWFIIIFILLNILGEIMGVLFS